MRINKDLMDSLMMIAFICLVLVGTTNYEHPYTKIVLMASFGFVVILTGVLRFIIAPKQ